MNFQYNILKGCSVVLLLLGLGFSSMAQTERDAQNLTETYLSGTAKSRAMGGALGAVGADPSAIAINPAGLGLYTSGAVSGTFSLGSKKMSSLWGQQFDMGVDKSKNIGGIDNFSYVSGLQFGGWSPNRYNFSVSFNRDKNFNRAYELSGQNMPSSIAEFAANTANGVPEDDFFGDNNGYDPYNNIGLNWFSVLTMNAGFIEATTPKGSLYRSIFLFDGMNIPKKSNLNVYESGDLSSFDFSFAASLSDYVYLGATLRTYSVSYNKRSVYSEIFDASSFYNADPTFAGRSESDDYLEISNSLVTKGGGVGLNLGVLINVGDYGRVGLSYLTPQYFQFTDSYVSSAQTYNWRFDKLVDDKGNLTSGHAFLSASTPDAKTDYRLIRPGVFTASAMFRLGRYGMVSYDFDYSNMSHMKMTFSDGTENLNNQAIKDQYGAMYSNRFGLELKPLPQLAIRAGAAFYTNPIVNERLRSENKDGLINLDLGTSGAMTDYLVSKNTTKYYTAGLGYSFSKHFGIDFAYVLGKREFMAYPYTTSFSQTPSGEQKVPSYGGKLDRKSNQYVFTLNYRF